MTTNSINTQIKTPLTAPQTQSTSSITKTVNQKLESLYEHLQSLFRTPAAEPLSKVENQTLKGKELTQRSGHLWDCVEERPNFSGGKIYIFKLKEKYDDVTKKDTLAKNLADQKTSEIYPAIEVLGGTATIFGIDDTLKSLFNSYEDLWLIGKHLSKFHDLGFYCEARPDGVYLHLPDQEALEVNWATLKEKHPDLPPLRILSSEGIATDLDYTEAFFGYDVVLSSGPEFIHDMMNHMLPTILFMFESSGKGDSSQNYEETRYRLRDLLLPFYKQAVYLHRQKNLDAEVKKIIPQFTALIGAFADVASALPSYQTLEIFFDKDNLFIDTLLTDTRWRNYFEKRFGEESFNPDAVKQLISELEI